MVKRFGVSVFGVLYAGTIYLDDRTLSSLERMSSLTPFRLNSQRSHSHLTCGWWKLRCQGGRCRRPPRTILVSPAKKSDVSFFLFIRIGESSGLLRGTSRRPRWPVYLSGNQDPYPSEPLLWFLCISCVRSGLDFDVSQG